MSEEQTKVNQIKELKVRVFDINRRIEIMSRERLSILSSIEELERQVL